MVIPTSPHGHVGAFDNPILYDEHKATVSRARRHPRRIIGENGESRVASMHETDIVAHAPHDDDEVYLVSHVERRYNFKSLVDRGANGGIAGDDMRLISHDAFGRTIDVQGTRHRQS